jgi:hypothetical protein
MELCFAAFALVYSTLRRCGSQQFASAAAIASRWIVMLPFFSHAVEQTSQEDARTAGRIEESLPEEPRPTRR